MSINPVQLVKLVKQYQTEAAKGSYVASNQEHTEMYELLVNNAKNEGSLDEATWKELLGFTQISVKTYDFEHKKNNKSEIALDDNSNVKDFLDLVEKYQLEADKKGNFNGRYEKRDSDLYKMIIGAACTKGEITKETYNQLLQFEHFGITTKTAAEEVQEVQENDTNDHKKLNLTIDKNYFTDDTSILSQSQEIAGVKYYTASPQGSDAEKDCTAAMRLTKNEKETNDSIEDIVLTDPKGKNDFQVDANANVSYSSIEATTLKNGDYLVSQKDKANNYTADIFINRRKVTYDKELYLQGKLKYNGGSANLSTFDSDDQPIRTKDRNNYFKANLGGSVYNYENGNSFGLFGEYSKDFTDSETNGKTDKLVDENFRIEGAFTKPLANGDRMGVKIGHYSSTISGEKMTRQDMEFIYRKKLSHDDSALNTGFGCENVGNSLPLSFIIGRQKTLKNLSYDYAIKPYYNPKGSGSFGADLEANVSYLYTKQNHRFEAIANGLYTNDMRLGPLEPANEDESATVSRSNAALRLNGVAQYSYSNKNHKVAVTFGGKYLNAQNYITSEINGEAKYQLKFENGGVFSAGVRGSYGTCYVKFPGGYTTDTKGCAVTGSICYNF